MASDMTRVNEIADKVNRGGHGVADVIIGYFVITRAAMVIEFIVNAVRDAKMPEAYWDARKAMHEESRARIELELTRQMANGDN